MRKAQTVTELLPF